MPVKPPSWGCFFALITNNLMDFKHRLLSAAASCGVLMIVRVLCSGDPVTLSTGPLQSSTTADALVVPEPFLPPLGRLNAPVVSRFGKRQIQGEPKPEIHEGVDFAAPAGTEVRASRPGQVIFAGFSKSYVSRKDKDDQHRLVIIRHADGMSTRYVHLVGLRVRPGQDVKAGQAIAALSESDEWTSPVLHFEIRDAQGRALNPVPLLAGAAK